jgi:hypothetical protein
MHHKGFKIIFAKKTKYRLAALTKHVKSNHKTHIIMAPNSTVNSRFILPGKMALFSLGYGKYFTLKSDSKMVKIFNTKK